MTLKQATSQLKLKGRNYDYLRMDTIDDNSHKLTLYCLTLNDKKITGYMTIGKLTTVAKNILKGE